MLCLCENKERDWKNPLIQSGLERGVRYGAWEDMKAFSSGARSALSSQVQGIGTDRDG